VVGAGTATITATASGISGTAALRGAPGLTSGVAVTPPTIAAEGFAIYAVVVPAGKTSLNISLSGGSGDADLYAFSPTATPSAVNTNPSALAFTGSTAPCPSALSGNAESCTFANPAAGVWRVHVFAWGPAGAVTGVSLTATMVP
jgi:serine protease